MSEGGNIFRRFQAGVDQLFIECGENAVAAGVEFANPVTVSAAGFNNTTGGGVDSRCHASRLGIKCIFFSIKETSFLFVIQWILIPFISSGY